MKTITEVIRTLKNSGSIYYFDADTFQLSRQRQDEIVSALIDSIGESKIKMVYSLEEFSALNLEEFNFVILNNAEEVNQFIKNSKYLVFYNEKLENSEELEGSEKKELLEIDGVFSDFCSKNCSFRICPHRLLENENENIDDEQVSITTRKFTQPKRGYWQTIYDYFHDKKPGIPFTYCLLCLVLSGIFIFSIYKTFVEPLFIWIVINVFFNVMNVIFGNSVKDIARWIHNQINAKKTGGK
ncbi:MAG: hypothetical protein JSV88_02690 [Candidatus Aminicenantes bacterium]|nr:MAG: hypothetical protein JSV88_02690 [Candidatus Aminicenantes bacterium]